MMKTLFAATAGLALAVPMTLPALASDHPGDEAKAQGVCSGTARWELKAEPEDQAVKVEFSVDSGVAGQQWDYTVSGPGGEILSGLATTDDEGEFEVKATTAGSVRDAFTAIASTSDQTCDSTVGIVADDDAEERDDDGEDIDEGMCTDDSSIELAVTQSGQNRVATLSVKGAHKGQKWHYKIKRGNQTVKKGAAKTRGKKAQLRVKAKTKGKGALTADAQRKGGSEECTTDDQYDD